MSTDDFKVFLSIVSKSTLTRDLVWVNVPDESSHIVRCYFNGGLLEFEKYRIERKTRLSVSLRGFDDRLLVREVGPTLYPEVVSEKTQLYEVMSELYDQVVKGVLDLSDDDNNFEHILKQL